MRSSTLTKESFTRWVALKIRWADASIQFPPHHVTGVAPTGIAPVVQSISPLLIELFRKFETSPAHAAAIAAMRKDIRGNVTMRHCIHTPDGFSSLRGWMVEQCASENIDFVR